MRNMIWPLKHSAFSKYITLFLFSSAKYKIQSLKCECAETILKRFINPLMSYWKRYCVTVKQSHGVVSRLWFGMLLRIAPSMLNILLIVMWNVCICGYYLWTHCTCIPMCFLLCLILLAIPEWLGNSRNKHSVLSCNAFSLWCVLSYFISLYPLFANNISSYVLETNLCKDMS